MNGAKPRRESVRERTVMSVTEPEYEKERDRISDPFPINTNPKSLNVRNHGNQKMNR